VAGALAARITLRDLIRTQVREDVARCAREDALALYRDAGNLLGRANALSNLVPHVSQSTSCRVVVVTPPRWQSPRHGPVVDWSSVRRVPVL
jgi:hypothetical protein